MNIIVNGGSKGIGKELVLKMAARRDNQIIVTGRNRSELKDLALGAEHANVSYITLDMTTLEEEIDSVREQIYNRFSWVDILINNAGNLIVKDFAIISGSEARTMMETNFFGPATFIRLLLPLLKRGSHIVNIASMGGFQGSSKYRGLAFYSASKAALACLTECLAVELKDTGISINCLALGSVETDMFKTAFPGYKAPVSASEMAGYIAEFAEKGGSFFNGRILPVALGNP